MGIFSNTTYTAPVGNDAEFQTFTDTSAKKPVVVNCDVNFKNSLPNNELPACIKVQMEVYVDEDNPELISGAEQSHIADIRSILSQHIGGRFVGQGVIAAQETAFLMFYCTDRQARLAKPMLTETFMGSFRHAEFKIIYDPEGEEYMKYLYPNPVKQRQIANAKMVRELKGYGDDGKAPRNIKYNLLFSNRAAAMDFFAQCADKGFTYTDLIKEPAPEGMVLPRYRLVMTKNMPFRTDLLEVVDTFLLALAEKNEATYLNIETDILELQA